MISKLITFTALLITTSSAFANLAISCGESVKPDGEVKNEEFLITSGGYKIKGVSGKDFDLTLKGQNVNGATIDGEGSSESGIIIRIVLGKSLGGNIGKRLEVDPWTDELTTTGRVVTVGGFAGGVSKELNCVVMEM